MNDPTRRTTNEIRMIAQGEIETQAKLCAAKRENLEDRVNSNTEGRSSDAQSIADLTKIVNDVVTQIAVLRLRVTIAAAIGGSLPIIAREVVQWFSSR